MHTLTDCVVLKGVQASRVKGRESEPCCPMGGVDDTRALNPRFYFVHARIAGTKPRFLTKMRHQNRGFRTLDDTMSFVKSWSD